MNTSLHGTDVLGAGFKDPRPFGFQGFNPYLETSPIYDYPPDDEWFVPKAGGGYQKVILGKHGGGRMVPGGWFYTGSYRGPWWGGNGPYMDVDDFVDPMERVDPGILGTHILGAYEVLGMFDIQAAQKKMNALPKQITVRMAQALLKGGLEAIDGAIALAKQKNLPGGTARNNVAAHLHWHGEKILTMVGGSPNAFYDPGQDLAQWTMRAFVEANAAEEGAAYLDAAWTQMWVEIAKAIEALPKQIRDAVMKTAGGFIEGVTGLPVWAWLLIIVGGTALVGYIAVKLIGAAANTKAGAAFGHVAARRMF